MKNENPLALSVNKAGFYLILFKTKGQTVCKPAVLLPAIYFNFIILLSLVNKVCFIDIRISYLRVNFNSLVRFNVKNH